MDVLRIGFIGLGAICRDRHIPGLLKLPGVALHAVANRTLESGQRAAKEFQIPHVHEDWRRIVEDPAVDVVFIGTWPYMHCEASIAALKAGKHVFCQARMAMNAREAEFMYRAAQDAHTVAGLCPVPFGLHVGATVKRIMETGEIGKIRYVQVRSFNNSWIDPQSPITWRKDHRLSGLNIQTLGMYIEVIHRWFGWTREVSASAFIHTSERPDGVGNILHIEIPDQVMVNTVVGSDLPVHYAISGMIAPGTEGIDIYGEQGTLHYAVTDDILYRVESRNKIRIDIPSEEAYDVVHWQVEADFIRAIREGTPYHPDFYDGLRYMQVIDAVHHASRTGTKVVMPEGGEYVDSEKGTGK